MKTFKVFVLAIMTVVLVLYTSDRAEKVFVDNVICFYVPDSMQEVTSTRASKYLYKLLYSDDISLPTIDGTVCWTRRTVSDGHSYGICFFREPFSLEVTDSFGGSQKIESITAIMLDPDARVIYFSQQPVSLGEDSIYFSQGNAVDDEEGQALLAKLSQEIKNAQN